MSALIPINFLDLVQRLSISVGLPGDGPTTVSGQSGESQRLVQWVGEAWLDIQQEYADAGFMLVSPGVSFATVAGQTRYTVVQTGIAAEDLLGHWKTDTFRVYLTSAGTPSEIHMTCVEYDEWRDGYNVGALRTAQVQPIVFAVHPDQSIMLECPLAGYTVTGDYFDSPSEMSIDSSVPAIPPQYIMMIIYKAMMSYGSYESAPEVYNDGEKKYMRMDARMQAYRTPIVRVGGALC